MSFPAAAAFGTADPSPNAQLVTVRVPGCPDRTLYTNVRASSRPTLRRGQSRWIGSCSREPMTSTPSAAPDPWLPPDRAGAVQARHMVSRHLRCPNQRSSLHPNFTWSATPLFRRGLSKALDTSIIGTSLGPARPIHEHAAESWRGSVLWRTS